MKQVVIRDMVMEGYLFENAGPLSYLEEIGIDKE